MHASDWGRQKIIIIIIQEEVRHSNFAQFDCQKMERKREELCCNQNEKKKNCEKRIGKRLRKQFISSEKTSYRDGLERKIREKSDQIQWREERVYT